MNSKGKPHFTVLLISMRDRHDAFYITQIHILELAKEI